VPVKVSVLPKQTGLGEAAAVTIVGPAPTLRIAESLITDPQEFVITQWYK
jgi:hypothetical protein